MAILTDLTDVNTIIERFYEQLKRVDYWNKKQINKGEILPATFPEEDFMVLEDNERGGKYCPFITDGVIPWVDTKNGDTWATIVAHNKYGIQTIVIIPFYYWNTIGSIGFITEHYTRFHSVSKQGYYFVKFLTLFTSHAMLRYKDRTGLDLQGFDLITYMMTRTHTHVAKPYIKEGRKNLDIAMADGVFRGEVHERISTHGCLLVKFKTFIPWRSLNHKEQKEMWELWQSKQYERSRHYGKISMDEWLEKYAKPMP